MKGIKNIVSILLVICIAMGLLAGCGGSAAPSAAAPASSATASGAASAPAAPSADRQKITLKIGGGHPSNTMAYTAVCQDFFQSEISRRCAEETNYDIEWIEAYGGTIAKLAECLTACQQGLLDVMCSSYSFDNKKLFLMNMPYYIPFSSPDPVTVTQAARKTVDQFPEIYENLWSTYNQKFLAFGPTGRYELITNVPVNSLSDLSGHKIAAAGANLPWLDAGNSIPVQSNLNEAYTSIQTGVYEGWVMWPDSSYRYKLHEVAPYYTFVGFGAMPIQGISINLDVWNKLDPSVQKIFTEVAAEYEVKSAETAKQWDEEATEEMKAAGVTVTDLPAADVEKWIESLPNIPQEKADEATQMGYPGVEIFNAYIAAQKELGYTYPREWVIE